MWVWYVWWVWDTTMTLGGGRRRRCARGPQQLLCTLPACVCPPAPVSFSARPPSPARSAKNKPDDGRHWPSAPPAPRPCARATLDLFFALEGSSCAGGGAGGGRDIGTEDERKPRGGHLHSTLLRTLQKGRGMKLTAAQCKCKPALETKYKHMMMVMIHRA